MTERSTKTVMWIMLVVILVLLMFIAYAFFIQPAYTGFVANRQNEGIQFGVQNAILQIAQQAAACQQVPLTIGNQTVVVIGTHCLSGLQPQG